MPRKKRVTNKTGDGDIKSPVSRPYTFPQSKSILDQADRSFPGLPVLIKRGRGARVITIDGAMLHDFWLAGGRYPFGHAPSFLTQAQKNAVSLGGLGSYPRNDHIRLLRRLARRLPGYTLYFARPGAAIPGAAEILDLQKSAFTTSNDIIPRDTRPDIIHINGALWLDITAVRSGLPAPAAEELPDAPSTACADAILRKLDSADAPYTKIAEHIALFKTRAASLLVNGDNSFFPRVAMNEEKRGALARAGFLLSPDGTIYFCAEHDPRAIIRLAQTLLELRSAARF
jgi:hypothetical protein